MNRREFLRNTAAATLALGGMKILATTEALAASGGFAGTFEVEEMAQKVMNDWGIKYENGCISAPVPELAGKQICADANTVRLYAYWDPKAGLLSIVSENKSGKKDGILFSKNTHPFSKPEDPLVMEFRKGE